MTVPQPRKKILGIGPAKGALAEFEQLCKDFQVHMINRGPREQAEIEKRCAEDGPFEAMFLMFANGSYAPMDEDLLAPLWKNGNNVGCFAQCGTGYDNVEVKDITQHGCVSFCTLYTCADNQYFTNTPDAVTEATADFTVAMFLVTLRGLTMASMAASAGHFHQDVKLTQDPRGLTVGILGFGRIAKDFARKVSPWNVKIQYNARTRRSVDEEERYGARYVEKDELFKTSDVIVILTPFTPETYHMVDRDQFRLMKGERDDYNPDADRVDGVYIINSSRGAVMNEVALIEALESGKVERAALDVYEDEPKINPYFLNNPRVTATPQTGKPETPVNGPF
ncbi:hypothetical protein IAR55_000338 [Kwoniella newhampshirensis]|uniref:D-isomer specific 2-hydroxyacid dehydrogenase NAD-binding domain-containing protein n=1 Tax=Kwoniella newhampshirensis TaxID=1651941 RepID=A0AAW0Z6F6_9TREE